MPRSGGEGPKRAAGDIHPNTRRGGATVAPGTRAVTNVADKMLAPRTPAGVAPVAAAASGAPSTPCAAPEASWSQVLGRKEKRAAKRTTAQAYSQNTKAGTAGKASTAAGTARKQLCPARPPNTTATALEVVEELTADLGGALMLARSKMRLRDLGITEVKARRAVTGGMLLEIPGPDGEAKADTLATRTAEVLVGTAVKVARPTKTAEIRAAGLDDSVTPKEVRVAIATQGGCAESQIKLGPIRRSPSALGTLWGKCPLAAVRKLVSAGKIRVGWTSARVALLAPRPMKC